MASILVLAAIVAYGWTVRTYLNRVTSVVARAGIIILAIALPSVDSIVGRIHLRAMCKEQGGLHVIRAVDDAAGFELTPQRPGDDLLQPSGYLFVEGFDINKKRFRLSKQPEGIARELNVEPMSEYLVHIGTWEEHGNYHRMSWTITTRKSNEVLGRFVNIAFSGGWVERSIGRLYTSAGAVASCQRNIPLTDFISSILKPAT
jgi:hypothetical protein